jgi:hypothetical protein
VSTISGQPHTTPPKPKTTRTTTAPPQSPLVLSVRATPSTLGYAGGTVQVAGEVKAAKSCQLQLLSHQGFPVVYASNKRPCANTFSARVTIGANPSPVARVIAFALVARNGSREFSGRFYVLLAANGSHPTRPKVASTPNRCTVTGVIINETAPGPQGNYAITVRLTNGTSASVSILSWNLSGDPLIGDITLDTVLAPGASTSDTVGANTDMGPPPRSKDGVTVFWLPQPGQYVGGGCS